MRTDQAVTDYKGVPLAVGTFALYGEDRVEVVAISDYDVDYCDATERPECFAPRVTFKWADGEQEEASTYDTTRLTWGDYPDGPAVLTFACDELEACPPSLPNGTTRERAVNLLSDYDVRMRGGYKNQQIAAREQLAFACGMGVRELRKWLANNP